MKIYPVDNQKDLFVVEDILPADLIEEINTQDFWGYAWEDQQMQSGWRRRKLTFSDESPLAKIDPCYNELLDQIEEVANVKFIHKHCQSSFWLDYAGFDCSIHEDGAERGYTPLMAMQVYLTESSDDLGTVWYHDQQGNSIRYAFPYKKNTGYLMLNHSGQWHGMLNKVPENHLRLSSYTYFGLFNHK